MCIFIKPTPPPPPHGPLRDYFFHTVYTAKGQKPSTPPPHFIHSLKHKKWHFNGVFYLVLIPFYSFSFPFPLDLLFNIFFSSSQPPTTIVIFHDIHPCIHLKILIWMSKVFLNFYNYENIYIDNQLFWRQSWKLYLKTLL